MPDWKIEEGRVSSNSVSVFVLGVSLFFSGHLSLCIIIIL